ncbi:MAG: YitT family protein [Anaerolineae bacterium]|nr:YitT family protein [Anaerolineae bacterium]
MTTSRFVSIAYRLLRLAIGAVISAIAVIVFEVPAQIAPGGISGIAIILNHLVPALPIGLMILIGNIPIQLIAFRFLGGWKVVAATIFTVVLYSLLIDIMTPWFNGYMMSHDRLLNAIFGGIIGGIGGGIVLAAGGTLGGTSTLGRILQKRYGTPLSSSTLYTDGFVVLGAGLVFGWEGALYAMVTLYVAAATTDYVLEGPSVIRTSVIITDHPRELADAITSRMGRGVTSWAGTGMYTNQPRTVLYVTMARSQVNELRRIVRHVDPAAFMVVGQGHVAYGHGFREAPVNETDDED